MAAEVDALVWQPHSPPSHCMALPLIWPQCIQHGLIPSSVVIRKLCIGLTSKTASAYYSESIRVKASNTQQRLIPVHCNPPHIILFRAECGPWQSDLHQGPAWLLQSARGPLSVARWLRRSKKSARQICSAKDTVSQRIAMSFHWRSSTSACAGQAV